MELSEVNLGADLAYQKLQHLKKDSFSEAAIQVETVSLQTTGWWHFSQYPQKIWSSLYSTVYVTTFWP